MNRPHVCLLVTLVAATCATAQQFHPIVDKGLYPVRNPATGAAFADFDSDGRPDLFVTALTPTSFSFRPGILMNRPNGAVLFEEVPFPSEDDDRAARAVAFGDFDSDGDVDIAWADHGNPNVRLGLNDGTGSFTLVPTPALPISVTGLSTADFDGDGDLDLLLTTGSPFSGAIEDFLWFNDGNAVFTDVSATNLNVSWTIAGGVAIGDIDGDLDLDVFIASSSAGGIDSVFWENDGTGSFTERATGLPLLARQYGAAFVDLDEDGDLDLLTNESGSIFLPDVPYVLINDGTGRFVDETASRFVDSGVEAGATVRPVDIDGDGDLDLLGAGLRINDGAGVFTPVPVPFGLGIPADVDLDGDIDVWSSSRIFTNDGAANFEDRTVRSATRLRLLSNRLDISPGDYPITDAMAQNERLRAVDIDHDGDLDFLSRAWDDDLGALRLQLYRNDGSDMLFPELIGPGFPIGFSDLAFGDIDQDGDTDIALAFGYLGFIGAAIPFDPETGQTRLFFNDGQGNLTDVTDTNFPIAHHSSYGMELCDVDGDMDLDLVIGNGSSEFFGIPDQNRLYLNDGTGSYTEVTDTHLPKSSELTYTVSSGDVDGDGDIDLMFGGPAVPLGGVPYLVYNDGTGHFGNFTELPAEAERAYLADFDFDGDSDAIFGSNTGIFLARATPSGLVVESEEVSGIRSSGFGIDVRLDDVDLDGDLDLWTGSDSILVNLHRHLDAPQLPRIGNSYVLRAHAMPGYAGGIPIAIPFVSFGEASLPSPFGRLGIDPLTATTLPVIALPLFGGSGDLALDIPQSAVLNEAAVFFQALIVDIGGASAPTLTNSIADRILGG